jgi:multiple sugar transport system permease protein
MAVTESPPAPLTAHRERAIAAPQARRRLKVAGKWFAILLIGAIFMFPIYWVVTMSFKPQREWDPPGSKTYWFPEDPTFDNYTNIFGIQESGAFLTSASRDASGPIFTSLITAIGGTLLALAIGILAAYGIARWRAGGRVLPFQILQLRMFPPVAIIIPILIMWVYLGLWDTRWGLIIIYGAVTVAFVVWLMRSFFQEVPREISEAAIVDGCTHWGAFWKTELPLVKGGLAATALFVFILNWSDFLIALILTQENALTAPVFLNSLSSSGSGQEYGRQAALAMILIIPPVLFGLAIQRYLVRGLTFGAIKR